MRSGTRKSIAWPKRAALLVLLGWFFSPRLWAEVYPPRELPARLAPAITLEIHAATDYDAMAPLLRAFQEIHPEIAIRYQEFETEDLDRFHRAEAGRAAPDILISLASDLQVKLVNDGFARPYSSLQTERLPRWANWRNEAFGFTLESAVMVVNTRLLGVAPPRDRHELLALLRAPGGRLDGRIVSYDIAASGVGYLFAAQDSLQASTYGRLLEAFNSRQAQVACCTSLMLEGLVEGRYLIGYNLLDGYARQMARRHPELKVIAPADYTLATTRVALLPRRSKQPHLGEIFLDFLLSPRGQAVLERESGLSPIAPQAAAGAPLEDWWAEHSGTLRPISLGPQLLVWRDAMKRERLLRDWGVSGD